MSQGPNRLDLGPEVDSAVMERFAAGVGFHALVDGLKLRPSRQTDPTVRQVLEQIAATANGVVDGLIAAGEYVDPYSRFSGPRPSWALPAHERWLLQATHMTSTNGEEFYAIG